MLEHHQQGGQLDRAGQEVEAETLRQVVGDLTGQVTLPQPDQGHGQDGTQVRHGPHRVPAGFDGADDAHPVRLEE